MNMQHPPTNRCSRKNARTRRVDSPNSLGYRALATNASAMISFAKNEGRNNSHDVFESGSFDSRWFKNAKKWTSFDVSIDKIVSEKRNRRLSRSPWGKRLPNMYRIPPNIRKKRIMSVEEEEERERNAGGEI